MACFYRVVSYFFLEHLRNQEMVAQPCFQPWGLVIFGDAPGMLFLSGRCGWDSMTLRHTYPGGRTPPTTWLTTQSFLFHTQLFFNVKQEMLMRLLSGTKTKSKNTTLALSSVRTRRTSMGRLIPFLVGLSSYFFFFISFIPSFPPFFLPSFFPPSFVSLFLFP